MTLWNHEEKWHYRNMRWNGLTETWDEMILYKHEDNWPYKNIKNDLTETSGEWHYRNIKNNLIETWEITLQKHGEK